MAHKSKGWDHGAFDDDSRKKAVIHDIDRERRRMHAEFEQHLGGHQVLLESDIVLVDEDTGGGEGFTTLPSAWDEWVGIPLGLGIDEKGHEIHADKALIHLEFQAQFKFITGGVKSVNVLFYFPLIGGVWTTPALDWAGKSTQVRGHEGYRGNTNDLGILTIGPGDMWIDVKDNKLYYWKEYILNGVTMDLITFHIVLKAYRRGER